MNKGFLKLLGFLTAAVMIFSLSACGGQSAEEADISSIVESTEDYGIDVIALATAGEIPEQETKLGDSRQTVKDHYSQSADASSEGSGSDQSDTDDHSTKSLTIDDNEDGNRDYIKMSTGEESFYYKKTASSKKISYIVNYTDAYGFAVGIAMPDDIKEAVRADAVEDTPVAADLFFLPEVPENCVRLSYTAGSNKLDFYFVDDFLSCIVLYSPVNWNI